MCHSHHGAISASNASDFQYDDMWHFTNQFFIFDCLYEYTEGQDFGLTSQCMCVCSWCSWESVVVWVGICSGYELSFPPKKNINKYNMYVWPEKAVRPDLCPCQLCASVHVAAYLKFMRFSFAGKASSEQFTTKMTTHTVKPFHTRCSPA